MRENSRKFMKHAGKNIMNERKNKMKKNNLNSKKINEQAKKLQQKCVEDIYNNDVYITHFFEIEILEKLNYETKNKEWTEEEQKQIRKIKSKIDDAISEVIHEELMSNPNSCLLKYVSGTKDFKSEVRASFSENALDGFLNMFDSSA